MGIASIPTTRLGAWGGKRVLPAYGNVTRLNLVAYLSPERAATRSRCRSKIAGLGAHPVMTSKHTISVSKFAQISVRPSFECKCAPANRSMQQSRAATTQAQACQERQTVADLRRNPWPIIGVSRSGNAYQWAEKHQGRMKVRAACRCDPNRSILPRIIKLMTLGFQ
jgi:hypothetical protein